MFLYKWGISGISSATNAVLQQVSTGVRDSDGDHDGDTGAVAKEALAPGVGQNLNITL
jgi:hypothetical protein